MDKKSITRIIKIVLWIAGLYASSVYSLHTLYFIFSGFYFMFTNLGKREEGTLSAYSVFNDNFERLAGTMDGMALFKSGGGEQNVPKFQEKKEEVPQKDLQKSRGQYFKNESKYGNKPCFCGSEIKFKKCCLISERKKVQKQRQNRIKGT